jgi:uridine kinase
MREQALGPLQEGRVASYRPYDWEDNTLASRTITIEPRPIVIVEGLFVSRPELDSINDLTVLVVTDPQVRNRRQFDRADASQEWLKRWNAAERWYFNHVRPPECFDLIVSGTRQT